jgi:hypothetical protein
MAAKYYVSKEAGNSGEHAVHKEGCSQLPSERIFLGGFSHCLNALQAAKVFYTAVDGCDYCSPMCSR